MTPAQILTLTFAAIQLSSAAGLSDFSSRPSAAPTTHAGSGTEGARAMVAPLLFATHSPARCQPESPRSALYSAGITPDSLAAAGVSASETAGVLSLATGYWAAHGDTISTSALSTTHFAAVCQQLEDLVYRGLAPAEQAASLPSLRQLMDNWKSERQSDIDSFFAAVTAELTEEQRETIYRINMNRKTSLPIPYRALPLTPDRAHDIRMRLAAHRIAASKGVQTELSLPNVSLGDFERIEDVEYNIQMNLEDVVAVWNALMNPA